MPRHLLAGLALVLLARGARAQSSSLPNPAVQFSTPGTKTVTLTVCKAGHCTTKTKTLQVLDPRPALTFAAVHPDATEVGQLVAFSAGASGRPPIAYTWRIYRAGTLVFTLPGAAPFWNTTGSPPAAYYATVTATNAAGSDTSSPLAVTLSPARPADFYTLKPCRVLDTRTGSSPLRSTADLTFATSPCGVPGAATAVAANVTVVTPSGRGYLTLFPANYPVPGTSTLNFSAGQTRANFALLDLATDGSGGIRAHLGSSSPALLATHLVVDLSGYFLPPVDPTPVAREFHAKLCSFGFCIFPASTPLFFVERVSGLPTQFLYDWNGDGTTDEASASLVVAHTYPAPGFFTPTFTAARGALRSTIPHDATLYLTAPQPAAVPPTPTGVSASFLALLPSTNPLEGTLLPTYRVSVASPSGAYLLGFNLYLSVNGGPYRLIYALAPDLPAADPLSIPLFNPSTDVVRLRVSALNYAGESPLSAPVPLSFPPSFLTAAAPLFVP